MNEFVTWVRIFYNYGLKIEKRCESKEFLDYLVFKGNYLIMIIYLNLKRNIYEVQFINSHDNYFSDTFEQLFFNHIQPYILSKCVDTIDLKYWNEQLNKIGYRVFITNDRSQCCDEYIRINKIKRDIPAFVVAEYSAIGNKWLVYNYRISSWIKEEYNSFDEAIQSYIKPTIEKYDAKRMGENI